MSISHSNPDQLLPSGEEGPESFIRVQADRLQEAAERLTATGDRVDPDHARRFIDYALEQRVDLAHFWARVDREERLTHAALCVPSPGKTCMTFCGHPARDDDFPPLSRLIHHACEMLHDTDLELAQVLLEPGETRMRQAYLDGGFQDLSMLSYLERPRPTRRHNAPPEWPQGAEITSYDESGRQELLDLLDATYLDTLDCPGLCGLRRTEDILEGHRASGAFEPSLWSILRRDGHACGAILLNPAPASDAIELVYMGLAPSARGKGLGTQLLRHGLSLLTDREERVVTLAVDDANEPALALYRRAGFRRVLQRHAMIRALRR